MPKLFLKVFLLLGLVLTPIAFKQKGIKDWVIVYLLTAFVSGIIDHILVVKKILSYPVRFYPKMFKYQIVFDWLLCPVISVFFNQLTKNDKSVFQITAKLFLFTIPQLLIEVLSGRYLQLVRWKKGWKWYYTFITMNVKFLIVRAIVQFIRLVHEKQFKNNDVTERRSSITCKM
ncbi:MAG: hypothetical protein LRY71_17025 [Bacillaceae bacterium]|nr:hypothetical protein [Bacillaceae bacterium]